MNLDAVRFGAPGIVNSLFIIADATTYDMDVRRFKLAGPQLPKTATPHRYLAIYEIETDAPEAFVKDMLARAIDGRLPASEACAPGSSGLLWEEER